MLARLRGCAALLAGLARATNTFRISLILRMASDQPSIGKPIDVAVTLYVKQRRRAARPRETRSAAQSRSRIT